MPDAIISLPLVVEEPVDITESKEAEEAEPPPEKASDERRATSGGFTIPSIETLIGDGDVPISRGGGSARMVLPPKPLEIAWPDARGLERCVGLAIELRIHVDKDGGIDRIEPTERRYPRQCLQAAVSAARKIVFSPGTIDGEPAAMWTTIRIDFKPKR